jgi:hypothetical protein
MSPLLVAAAPAGTAQVAVPVQNPTPPPGRGMSKRIRRLPASFDAQEPEQPEKKAEKADGGTA